MRQQQGKGAHTFLVPSRHGRPDRAVQRVDEVWNMSMAMLLFRRD